jgi:hypothetical protein
VYSSTLLVGPKIPCPPAMITLPFGSSVAVASARPLFIVGVERRGEAISRRVIEIQTGEDESPPHPASTRTMLKTTTSRNADFRGRALGASCARRHWADEPLKQNPSVRKPAKLLKIAFSLILMFIS